MTQAGLSFIKAASCPADFQVGEFVGIPDEFDGHVVTKTDALVAAGPTFTEGADGYILLLPIPGVAYLYGEHTTPTHISFTPVFYPNNDTVFPAAYTDKNFNKFRYGAQAMEIIPTVNAMTWTGSVQVFRGPIDMTTSAFAPGGMYTSITGPENLLWSSLPDVVHPFNHGCYCVARHTEADHPFRPIVSRTLYSELSLPPAGVTMTWGIAGDEAFTGLGNMEAVLYKIPMYSAAGNQYTIRTWASLEYQVATSSLYYQFTHPSPAYDPLAIAMLRRLFNEIQVCVPYYENDGLWNKIWTWLSRATTALSFVPGPVGEIAGGASTMMGGISAVTGW